MVSLGPDTQSYNYTHMYSFVDYRGTNSQSTRNIVKDTILDFIYNNPNFSRFKMIIERSGMLEQLNNSQANMTLFVPSDDYLRDISDPYFYGMDIGLARQILNSSSLNRKIGGELVKSSPVSYFTTRDSRMRMYVTNISGITQINNCVRVVKYDILLNNGIIHLVDGLIIPSDDTFMN